MEFYNEIHGAPIFDVYAYDDDDVEASLCEVQDEFQKLKFSVVDKFKVIEETMNRLMEAANRSIYGGGRARGGNNQRSERSNATSHHTSRTKKRHRPVRAKKTPQTEKKKKKKKKTSQTTRTTTKGATKMTKKFTPTGRGIKKLQRHHVRTIVICERITKLLICKLPFQRLVHDRGRHRNFPMKHSSSDLPRQPSHSMSIWSLVQTRFLHQCVNHGCYHGSNKKLLEFGVGGFTHKSMNFGDKVLLDGGVMMRYYLRKKMTWPRGLVILISSGDVVLLPTFLSS